MAITAGIMIAGTVASSAISAHSASSAADTQSASADKALGVQQQVYQNTQNQIAPYQALGTGSLSNLASYANAGGPVMNASGVGYHPAFTPSATTASTPTTMGQTTTSPATAPVTVTVRAPNGETRAMTRAQAEPFLANGATLVQTPGMAGGGRVGRTAMGF